MTAEEIARRAAVAVDNAALYRQEQSSRAAAERNAERVAALQSVTAALGTAVSTEQVSRVVLEQGMQALGAQGVVLAQLSGDGQTLRVVGSFGYAQEMMDKWQEFPASMHAPLADAVRKRELLVFETPEAFAAHYPDWQQANREFGARMVMPLLLEGRAVGGLYASFARTRSFSENDRIFGLALAHQYAQALERARLFESEQVAREAAERAAQRSQWLTEASHLLGSSLEYEKTLKELARLAVPEIADWCTIHIAKGDGTAEQLVLAHKDPEMVKWAEDYGEEIRQYFTPHPDAPMGLPHVLRTGESELYPQVPDALLQEATENPTQLEILRKIGLASVMIVPLSGQGKTLGAITLVNTESRRHFTQDDLAFAELLAGRAAVAIENARLYRETQTLNAELEARVQQRTYELNRAYDELSQEVVERARAEETTRTLLRISSKLNSTLDVDASLEILIQEALRMLEATSGFAGLRTAQGMELRAYYAGSERVPVEYTWGAGEGLPGWVLEHRAPYMTNDAGSDPVMPDNLELNHTVRSAICTPIFDAEDRIAGFFSVRDKQNGQPFTEGDVDFLMALSPIAAIAIQNAQAYEKISRAEGALKTSYAQLRALNARLHTVREEERRDIARELHDELGQALTALKMDLAAMTTQFPKRTKFLHERAAAMSNQIDATIRTVRRMSSQLRPGMLDDLGLGPSMEWYAQEFQTRTGIRTEVQVPEQELELSSPKATALYRIFQEALTNVARHANAQLVRAGLRVDGNAVQLEIADDGQGFDMQAARGKQALGLLGMRERAEMVQGKLEIRGVPGKGTTVIAYVPLDSGDLEQIPI